MANKKSWVAASTRRIKPTVPDTVKSMLKEKADKLIDEVIKPQHVKPAPPPTITTILLILIASGTGIIFTFMRLITVPALMQYPLPLIQDLHEWNMLQITHLILRTCGIQNSGLNCSKIFRWTTVLN